LRKGPVYGIISHILIVLALYLLQTAVFSRLRINTAAPLLLPLAAVGFGLFEGGFKGGVWGLICGVLCDISLGDSGLLFTVFLTFAGFFTGFLSEFFLARGFPSYLTMSLLTLVLSVLLQLVGPHFYRGAPLAVLWKPALIQTIYSAIFIIPVYYPIHRATRASRRVRI